MHIFHEITASTKIPLGLSKGKALLNIEYRTQQNFVCLAR